MLLLPLIENRGPARIVNVSSAGHQPIDFGDVMLTRGYQRDPSLLSEPSVPERRRPRRSVDRKPQIKPLGAGLTRTSSANSSIVDQDVEPIHRRLGRISEATYLGECRKV